MWIRNTEETEAIHVPGMSKETVMDGFVHPFKAVTAFSPNGDLYQEIRGGRLGKVDMMVKDVGKIAETIKRAVFPCKK